jgi:hypothetical protein
MPHPPASAGGAREWVSRTRPRTWAPEIDPDAAVLLADAWWIGFVHPIPGTELNYLQMARWRCSGIRIRLRPWTPGWQGASPVHPGASSYCANALACSPSRQSALHRVDVRLLPVGTSRGGCHPCVASPSGLPGQSRVGGLQAAHPSSSSFRFARSATAPTRRRGRLPDPRLPRRGC